ncbi:MAG: YtxH domain-containing protein [Candidatus Pedobacter colombiensis]|uniref:YtxH domain-containing protein n=1 Tax=Candidatus Pedobacter colombiensis TaxID=3121371 RepID=A0AAJ6B573_9SPHI|nr:YtxH domain-containing protein [Pedobacter sp.]WEK17479.1 MAG: YtxH domain-containing protein [Pedobacter sp.]
MNYKKLISSRMPTPSYNPTDTTGSVVALLAGLAVGAVLGVLFAPESGKKTRGRISDKAMDAADGIKNGYQSIKDHITMHKDNLVDLKDQVVDNVKSKAATVSKEFKDFKDTEIRKVKSSLKHSADGAAHDF